MAKGNFRKLISSTLVFKLKRFKAIAALRADMPAEGDEINQQLVCRYRDAMMVGDVMELEMALGFASSIALRRDFGWGSVPVMADEFRCSKRV